MYIHVKSYISTCFFFMEYSLSSLYFIFFYFSTKHCTGDFDTFENSAREAARRQNKQYDAQQKKRAHMQGKCFLKNDLFYSVVSTMKYIYIHVNLTHIFTFFSSWNTFIFFFLF